ncbi:cytochrome c oxidase subunit NDUFA4 isoform X1 [Megalobrama amblycephala]|uniref:cytochrome c oxidase subunit NDUFA4 isoform X1 n=1 Tax=Megalobrama amblycephala TaxID=75352 RepID=UPI0020144F17|nr:cytochrome c oxidase subunit NDUFA4 isoform X1 [Megalobrama amblycephala]
MAVCQKKWPPSPPPDNYPPSVLPSFTVTHPHRLSLLPSAVFFHSLSFSSLVWPYPHSVSWDRKNNPEPWNKLDPTYQYKLVAITTDYESLKKEGPDF